MDLGPKCAPMALVQSAYLSRTFMYLSILIGHLYLNGLWIYERTCQTHVFGRNWITCSKFTNYSMLNKLRVIYVIGCWARPGTTSVYTKEKMSEWPWSLRSSKDIFKGLHYPLTWSNGLCGGRGKRGVLRKRQGPMAEKCCHNNIFVIFFFFGGGGRRKDEDMRRQENGQTWFFFQKYYFGEYIQKNQRTHFLVHGHSSWSTFGVYLVRGPRTL